jgi:tetratricopeptide (TPR) repeat protein
MAHTYNQGDEPVPGSGYHLSSFLGRGGFGEVWKATAPGGAEAALKIIHLGGQEGRKEFRALQLVKRIRHPNLMPIIGFWLKGEDGTILDDAVAGQEDLPTRETTMVPLEATMVVPPVLQRPQAAELIVAMGLGDLSLADRLQQCRAQGLSGIPPDEILGYLEDVAEAIDFLNSPVHDLGSEPAAIQHCDIKPQNLMIVGGAAQICDFGLARMMGADRTTSAAATIAYAAPECLQTGRPSASTDQYSLAVSYYELRTGALPYRDETLAAVLDAKQQEKLDFSRLTAAEQAVLRRATLRDPAQRFPSAVAMVDALREAASAPAVSAPGGEVRGAARHGRRLLGSLVLVAMLAGVVWGGWLIWSSRGEHPLPGGAGEGTPLPGPTNPPPPPPGIEQRADGMAERGDFNGAIALYTKLIGGEAPPAARVEVYFKRGRCQLNLKQYDQAIADFEEAVRLDANDAHGFKQRKEYLEAYLARGMRMFEERQYDRAIADLERAAELRPLDARASKALAQAYLEQGTAALKKDDYDGAIKYFDQASQYDPGNPLIFVRRAGAWFGKKNLAEAIKDLTTSIGIKENDKDYLTRGLAYREEGDLDKALADFADAIRLNPQNAAAFAHRGEAYMTRFDTSGATADLDLALADLSRAVQLCRDNPQANFHLQDALLWRASCYLLAKKYDLAAADFTEILGSGGESPKSLHVLLDQLAGGFAEQRELPKAVQWETKAIELAPDEDTKTDYQSRLKQYQAGKP